MTFKDVVIFLLNCKTQRDLNFYHKIAAQAFDYSIFNYNEYITLYELYMLKWRSLNNEKNERKRV